MFKNYVLLLTLFVFSVFQNTQLLASHLEQDNIIPSIEQSSDEILVKGGVPKVALILFPGGYIAASRYVDLAQAIVRSSRGEVAVYIPKFYFDFSNPLQSKAKIMHVVSQLRSIGLDTPEKRVFLAGHSQGGITASGIAESMELGGVILLGSYLPETFMMSKQLATFELPVLTLGGELDGLTGINYLAREYNKLQTIAQKNASLWWQKPVIVLRGTNHTQFMDGAPFDSDLSSEITLTEAHEAIAHVITTFIGLNSPFLTGDRTQLMNSLMSEIRATASLLLPFSMAPQMEQGLCTQLQKEAAPLSEGAYSKIAITEKVYNSQQSSVAFIFDKARTSVDGDKISLHLPVYFERPPNVADISKNHWLAPEVIGCKMRTQSSLAKETGLTAQGRPKGCAELNALVIQKSLRLISDSQQIRRLESLYGQKDSWEIKGPLSSEVDGESVVTFGPFTIKSLLKSTGQAWVASRFHLKKLNDGFELQTAELLTADDVAVRQFAGANYCKVLPPSRIIEWATLFGLK